MQVTDIRRKLAEEKIRGTWNKAIIRYAFDLLSYFEDDFELTSNNCERELLNGSDSWKEYSWNGNSLIYDQDICERLTSPSVQKRKQKGKLPPNKHSEWLDIQARALFQAYSKIFNLL